MNSPMKSAAAPLLCVVLCLVQARATFSASITDFLSPPGAMWAVLPTTNVSPKAICAIPGGFIIAGHVTDQSALDKHDWGFVARGNASGALVSITNFHSEANPNALSMILPLQTPGGTLDGYLFAGWQSQPITDSEGRHWNLPWLWLLRTDINFVKQWGHVYGEKSYIVKGESVLNAGGDFLVGCSTGTPYGPAQWRTLYRIGNDGAELSRTNMGWDRVWGVQDICSVPGGYVLAVGEGLVKLNSALEVIWWAGHTAPDEQHLPDGFRAVKLAADGSLLAAGTRWKRAGASETSSDGNLLLSKFSEDGARVWDVTFGDDDALDEAVALLLSPDGGCVILGNTRSKGHGGSDVWLVKTDSLGAMQWDILLGGEGDDRANSLALADDGHFLIAADAAVPGVAPSMWLLKMTNSPHVPIPSFTYSPDSARFPGPGGSLQRVRKHGARRHCRRVRLGFW